MEINLAVDCFTEDDDDDDSGDGGAAEARAGDRRPADRRQRRGVYTGRPGDGCRRCPHDNVAIMYPFTSVWCASGACAAVAAVAAATDDDDGDNQ